MHRRDSSLPHPRHFRRRALSALLLFAAVLLTVSPLGCGHVPVVVLPPPPPPEPAPEISGVWEWIFRSTDEQGDVRIEEEQWHLEQRGEAVKGYYERAVTMRSTDERLFRCNRQLGFTRFTRVQVVGTLSGERMTLNELAFEAKPGPCDDGARNLVKYVGELRDQTIKLRWAPHAGQTLHRREAAGAAVAKIVGLDAELGPATASAGSSGGEARISIGVGGVWEWELKSIDAEGDERIEREEWHLVDNPDGIGGFYERHVTRVRDGGKFTCSAADRFVVTTLYTVAGTRLGDRVTLTEVDYKAPASKCDNGQRRLDTYRGTLSGDGDELVLSWGPGNQLLHRRR